MQRTLLLALLVISLRLPLSAQVSNISKVAWQNVPMAVQQAIQANGSATPPATVERGVENGQTVFSVTVPSGTAETRVIVRENGTFVQPPLAVTNLGTVVAPVPETVVATNTLPEGVTRETAGGRTIYNVTSEGAVQSSQVRITPDARVISTTQVGPQGVVEMQKLNRETLPPAVERAIQTQTGPGQIVDIVQGTFNGQSVYDVVYNQADERIKLRVGANGVVLGQSILSTEDSRVIDVEPWIGYHQVPVVVQTTLSVAAGDQPIENVRQEVVDGRVTYVGTFRDSQTGQPSSVRVSQTGQLLR